jgi:PadR family transcriptional regulator PadR
MSPKRDVWQGTLALMILRTLDTLGPLHGYGVARRIEQTSDQLLAINQGTLYPQLMKLEEDGYIRGSWGVSENGQRAKFYRLTRSGRRRLAKVAQDWEQTTAILAKFLAQEGTR